MTWLIFAIVVAVLALAAIVGQRNGWVDLSGSHDRRGGSTSVMAIGDEVFNPTRFEAQVELDRQTILPAPAPLPGDGDKGVYGGSVRIQL